MADAHSTYKLTVCVSITENTMTMTFWTPLAAHGPSAVGRRTRHGRIIFGLSHSSAEEIKKALGFHHVVHCSAMPPRPSFLRPPFSHMPGLWRGYYSRQGIFRPRVLPPSAPPLVVAVAVVAPSSETYITQEPRRVFCVEEKREAQQQDCNWN